MYPTVRPGDLLHVLPTTAQDAHIGDMAVCRRPDFLFGHRIIGMGVDAEGACYILTRSDRARRYDDGPTYDEDLLGVVTEIERRGRRLSTAPQTPIWPVRMLLSARLRMIEAWPAVQRSLRRHLDRLGELALYGRLAALWFRITQANPTYEVRLPLREGRHHNLYHRVPLAEFDAAAPTWRGAPPRQWTLALLLYGNRRPAAQASYSLHPQGCPRGAGWQMDAVHVRGRYHGAGLERQLRQVGAAILAHSR